EPRAENDRDQHSGARPRTAERAEHRRAGRQHNDEPGRDVRQVDHQRGPGRGHRRHPAPLRHYRHRRDLPHLPRDVTPQVRHEPSPGPLRGGAPAPPPPPPQPPPPTPESAGRSPATRAAPTAPRGPSSGACPRAVPAPPATAPRAPARRTTTPGRRIPP